MKKRTKWILGGAAGLVIILVGLGASTGREGEGALTVEEAKLGDLRDTVTANGEIQAKTKVNVGTSVTGEIKEIHVKDGQYVKAGDLLVTLDQERFLQQKAQADLTLKGARQDLANAEATFHKTDGTFRRNEALAKQGLISTEEFQTQKLARENAQNGLERAKVAVAQAQANLALAVDSLSKTVLRASMSGRVTGLQAEKGETAIAGQTNIAGAVLMVISDMSEMLAEVKVGELEVVKLRPGALAEIQLDALPGQTFKGTVMAVATAADRGRGAAGGGGQESQNYKVRILLNGTPAELDSLRPGMNCRVAVLAREAKQVLTVPLSAVQEREIKAKEGETLLAGSRMVVYVAKDGKAQERTVKTGLVTRKAVQLLEGVKAGETVVTGPSKAMTTLSDGQAVKVKAGKPAGGKP